MVSQKVYIWVLDEFLKCHPIKILGGKSGIDLVPRIEKGKNGQ